MKKIVNVVLVAIFIAGFIGVVTIDTPYTWRLYLYYILTFGSFMALIKVNKEAFLDFFEKMLK